MSNLTEAKFQNWRAMVQQNDGTQHLLFVGRSWGHVMKGYNQAFFEVLTEDEQVNIKHIRIEKWKGLPDCGHWQIQDMAEVPKEYIRTFQSVEVEAAVEVEA